MPNRTYLLILILLAATAAPARAELDSKRWKDLVEKIEEQAEEKNERGVAGLLPEVGRDDTDRAVKLLISVFQGFPESIEVWRAANNALDAMKSEKALKHMKDECAGAKDWKVRSFLFDALARKKALDTPALLKALGDKQEEVALGAVREIGRTKTLAGVDALCDFMAKVESKGGLRGVVWQAARNVLVRLLYVECEGGQDFKNHLDLHRKEFVDGRGLPPTAAQLGDRAKDQGQTIALFGQQIQCKNVVLIIDVSGSMEIPDPAPQSTTMRDPNQDVDETRRRIYRAKEELKRVLELLARAKARINILAYSTDVTPWRPEGLHELGAEGLRSACAFVDGFKAEGVTATDTALETAFRIAPNADCFYLISDGYATHDESTPEHPAPKIPTKRIVDGVSDLNRLRHVQINTLGFVTTLAGAPSADPELLKAIAEATGGQYSEIK